MNYNLVVAEAMLALYLLMELRGLLADMKLYKARHSGDDSNHDSTVHSEKKSMIDTGHTTSMRRMILYYAPRIIISITLMIVIPFAKMV
jgi:hypothetical protein